ncbi:MAG TPA: carboxypeptidase-like regulatory domain-containing protein, partial [Proteiniphilum sp.]|nr:carboxypeptidase-like regulatory domain-containing protein [Proteiniphilum sp.]
MKLPVIFTLFFLLIASSISLAETINQGDSTFVLKGRVVGSDTNQPLVNASIMVKEISVSSITNQEGYFSIRVPSSSRNAQLVIRHLGYQNKSIPVITLIESPNNHIMMSPSPIQLSEVLVVSGDGRNLVKEAYGRMQYDVRAS